MSGVLATQTRQNGGRVMSPFEFWPNWIFYTPVVLQWVALGIYYRGFSLPTAANPSIETGGLCGESKSSILDQVGDEQRTWLADYIVILTGVDSPDGVLNRLAASGLSFPLVAKPDVGCHGNGVRLVEDGAALERVLADYPANVRLLLQEFVAHEGEAGVFYVKEPGHAARVTSLTLKYAPLVRGNGKAPLCSLIDGDPRLCGIKHLFAARFRDRMDEIIPLGQTVRLVFTGNHCKGSLFRDGEAEITSALTRRMELICDSMTEFHFGRIDLRFSDLSALRRGEEFKIIEINGVGSEATHIWDPQTRLIDAYRAQFQHYGLAFRIGRAMRRGGHRPSSLMQMLKSWRRQTRLMASYPASD